MRKKFPIYVVLENIRSLYNVGAIFRTSDGAGVEKIFLCGITGCPDSEGSTSESVNESTGSASGRKISKTALGAEKSVEWEYEEEAVDVIKKLKKKGVQIVGVEICKGAENYFDAKMKFPIALVFGHETEGVSQDVLNLCDKVVFVPMHGIKESLNVEAAFSTVVYEMVRRYNSV